MNSINRDQILERLKHSIQLLGSSAEVQFKMLPGFVCKVDELALDFDHWKTVVVTNFAKNLTEHQVRSLNALDESLEEMSHLNQEMWTEDAVRESIEWQRIRVYAQTALESFGWHLQAPPSHASEFVGGS